MNIMNMELKQKLETAEETASRKELVNAVKNAEDYAARFGGKWHVVEMPDGTYKVRDDANVINGDLNSIYDTNLKELYPGDFDEEYYNQKKSHVA